MFKLCSPGPWHPCIYTTPISIQSPYSKYSESTGLRGLGWKKYEGAPSVSLLVQSNELELLLNQYLYSLQTGDSLLYISSLDGLMPYVFTLDHVHCARWLPVHILDMVQLKDTHPEVFEEFMKGNFVVHRSSHRFSSIALDQSHEQTKR